MLCQTPALTKMPRAPPACGVSMWQEVGQGPWSSHVRPEASGGRNVAILKQKIGELTLDHSHCLWLAMRMGLHVAARLAAGSAHPSVHERLQVVVRSVKIEVETPTRSRTCRVQHVAEGAVVEEPHSAVGELRSARERPLLGQARRCRHLIKTSEVVHQAHT
eukprot:CAMPEP_0185194478 /NCGR_PEP_ID=MMETSP1140-20130426/31033_1 /TAXON_ID=298111 /ORGANISM="Pavlova sp., Strain CCMP459" /LENGTH=161 /DNA_ID=CAMNT_0027761409 /DNA_START=550 /DNA_END=1031 /DNA_ORIENTATION=+